MKEEQYLNERLENQLKWYSNKSANNKMLHLWTQALVIIFSALIPFLAGFMETGPVYLNYIIGVLGMLVAILAGVSAMMKFQEKWVKYRTASETLKHEKFMYITRTGHYKGKGEHFNILVTRVENLISKENSLWSEYMSEEG